MKHDKEIQTLCFDPIVTEFKLLSAYAAVFGSVPKKPAFQKCVVYFLKEAKTAEVQLCSSAA